MPVAYVGHIDLGRGPAGLLSLVFVYQDGELCFGTGFDYRPPNGYRPLSSPKEWGEVCDLVVLHRAEEGCADFLYKLKLGRIDGQAEARHQSTAPSGS